MSANESGSGALLDGSSYVPTGAQRIYAHGEATVSGSCQPRVLIGGVCNDLTSTDYKVSVVEFSSIYYPIGPGSPLTAGGGVNGNISCSNGTTASSIEFLVQDPDGYLLRFVAPAY